jgi:methionyl-tRNA formyltransferase
MTRPRTIFMGTPSFALPALERLCARNYPIVGVVTQPDRPQGRGQKYVPPPVKQAAEKLGLPVLQPKSVKDQSFLEIFRKLDPEIVVVAAFGQILPKAIIDFPPLCCLNIHPSLLPKYRGAAPINWAIIRGEASTGVTIMLMDEGMDSGDILLQEEVAIDANESYGDLHDRLSILGAALLMEAIDRKIAGAASARAQDSSLATYAPRLTKESGCINWNCTAAGIVNLIRGLSPAPAAYTFLEGKALRIFTAEVLSRKAEDAAGTVGTETAEGLPVVAADGYVLLKDVQLAGKKRMPVHDFLRGCRLNPGTVLG